MKKQTTKSNLGALPRIIKATFIAGLLPALVLLFSIQASQAGSATWNLNPTNGDWFTASNWTPATVPNGPKDTATFGVSNVTGISTEFPGPAPEVNGIVFDPGASAYSITVAPYPSTTMTISGAGITNNSGSIQNFNVGGFGETFGVISFTNNATAGSLTTFTMWGDDCNFTSGGQATFFDTSSAGSGTFINNGSIECVFGPCGATTGFDGTSSAGNAVLIANGGTGFSLGGGAILFTGNSTGNTGSRGGFR